jgi:PERQ amino acid-rich with GYF domain-containing protein
MNFLPLLLHRSLFVMTNNTRFVPNAHQTAPRARRTNGATQTFRRPSHATSLSGSTAHSASREAPASQNASNPGVYVPPHAQPGRNGSSAEGRFSRDQLTQLFRAQRDGDELADGLSSLSMGAWDSHATNGAAGASWGRNHDHSRDVQSGVEQCWDRDGSIEPLSLRDLTDEEREVMAPLPAYVFPKVANVHSSLRSSCRRSTRR